MSADSELWYVKVLDGTVHPATLEQIDEAFNAGCIDANTLVLPTGETRWKRLGELAGLDAAPSEAPSSVSPVVVAAAPASVAPPSLVPSSLRPMTFDLDGDDDAAALRPRSGKKMFFGVLTGALLVGGVAFAATHSSLFAATAPPPAAAAAPSPPPPAPQPDPATAAAAAAPADATPRFSDEQKQRLLAADKEREEAAKAKHAKFHPGSFRHGSHGKSQGFTTGGNKYDPLNASF